jgi:hypothetical protein
MRKDQYLNSNFHSHQEEVKTFVKNLSEKDSGDLTAILTRYLSYKQETVEAALIVSVDKGLISYDLREQLWDQIDDNFAALDQPVKNFSWEANNAFVRYVSNYSDEEIYRILEDPNEIVIDVYHAFLLTAKERELISEADFKNFYEDAKMAGEGEEVKMHYDIADLFRSEASLSDEPDEAEIEAEKEKYWKCPKCNEMVGMEFGVCWNCAAEVPEVIEHPDVKEVLKERTMVKRYTPLGIGLRLIVAGVFIIVIDFFRHYDHISNFRTHIGGYIFGGIFILVGLAFLIYGSFFNSENN